MEDARNRWNAQTDNAQWPSILEQSVSSSNEGSCQACGSQGHSFSDCGYRKLREVRKAHRTCAYCGGKNHPFASCREKASSRMYRTERGQCRNCGDAGHSVKTCPLPLQLCGYCQKAGHHLADCFQNSPAPIDRRVYFVKPTLAKPRSTLKPTEPLAVDAPQVTLDISSLIAPLIPALALTDSQWEGVMDDEVAVTTPEAEFGPKADVEALKQYVEAKFMSEPVPVSTNSRIVGSGMEQDMSDWRGVTKDSRASAIKNLKQTLKYHLIDIGLQLAAEEITLTRDPPQHLRGYIRHTRKYFQEHQPTHGDRTSTSDDQPNSTEVGDIVYPTRSVQTDNRPSSSWDRAEMDEGTQPSSSSPDSEESHPAMTSTAARVASGHESDSDVAMSNRRNHSIASEGSRPPSDKTGKQSGGLTHANAEPEEKTQANITHIESGNLIDL